MDRFLVEVEDVLSVFDYVDEDNIPEGLEFHILHGIATRYNSMRGYSRNDSRFLRQSYAMIKDRWLEAFGFNYPISFYDMKRRMDQYLNVLSYEDRHSSNVALTGSRQFGRGRHPQIVRNISSYL